MKTIHALTHLAIASLFIPTSAISADFYKSLDREFHKIRKRGEQGFTVASPFRSGLWPGSIFHYLPVPRRPFKVTEHTLGGYERVFKLEKHEYPGADRPLFQVSTGALPDIQKNFSLNVSQDLTFFENYSDLTVAAAYSRSVNAKFGGLVTRHEFETISLFENRSKLKDDVKTLLKMDVLGSKYLVTETLSATTVDITFSVDANLSLRLKNDLEKVVEAAAEAKAEAEKPQENKDGDGERKPLISVVMTDKDSLSVTVPPRDALIVAYKTIKLTDEIIDVLTSPTVSGNPELLAPVEGEYEAILEMKRPDLIDVE